MEIAILHTHGHVCMYVCMYAAPGSARDVCILASVRAREGPIRGRPTVKRFQLGMFDSRPGVG